ncbi:hypothetical protein Tco_1497507, partial [Tanacetum coccineum]
MKIVEEARVPPPALRSHSGYGWGDDDEDDDDDEKDNEGEARDEDEVEEDEYDKRVKEAHKSGEIPPNSPFLQYLTLCFRFRPKTRTKCSIL